MFFLEGEEEESNNEQSDFYVPPPPPRQAQESKSNKSVQSVAHDKEIQDRVNKAIRNSIKLINGLKPKDA